MNPVRVALVDPRALVVDALTMRLSNEPDIVVVGTAQEAAAARELVKATSCEVVVIGASDGSYDTLALAGDLIGAHPGLGIVVVSERRDDDRVLEAVRAGVRGWIDTSASMHALLAALRAVGGGSTHIPSDLLTGVLGSIAKMHSGGHTGVPIHHLSPREFEVLACLSEGLGRGEIAERLRISPNTVRTHVQSILTKLHVHSALAAVALARQAGSDLTTQTRTQQMT